MKRLEWWFDFSCPYAYLSSVEVEALAKRTGAELVVEPMLLGGVFRAREVPQKLFATLGEQKARHNANDLARYARLFGAEYSMPSAHPFRTVEALRALLVVGAPYLPLVHAFYRAYWIDGLDIGARPVLEKILTDNGHDAAAVLSKIGEDDVKADLRRRTDEAIERGVFGAPAFFVDGELFWGQDRMDYVERALGGTPPVVEAPHERPLHPVDFYFDYSSPFAYLGAVRAERLFGSHAEWRPMLLGAVFKAVDQVMVPLYAMSEAKRAYQAEDLRRQAEAEDVPFRWPTRFPMNTVLALRVTLAAGTTGRGRKLVRRLFEAYWAEDRDIADPAVVAAVADEVGLDGAALVAGAGEQKQALFDSTGAAVQAGVFGAPAAVVKPEGRAPSLYWGSDRLTLADLAARGRDDLL